MRLAKDVLTVKFSFGAINIDQAALQAQTIKGLFVAQLTSQPGYWRIKINKPTITNYVIAVCIVHSKLWFNHWQLCHWFMQWQFSEMIEFRFFRPHKGMVTPDQTNKSIHYYFDKSNPWFMLFWKWLSNFLILGIFIGMCTQAHTIQLKFDLQIVGGYTIDSNDTIESKLIQTSVSFKVGVVLQIVTYSIRKLL